MKLSQLHEAKYAGGHPAVKFIHESIDKLYHRHKPEYSDHRSYHMEMKIDLNLVRPTVTALKAEFGQPYHDWPEAGQWEWEYEWSPDEEHTIKEYAFLVNAKEKDANLLVEEMR